METTDILLPLTPDLLGESVLECGALDECLAKTVLQILDDPSEEAIESDVNSVLEILDYQTPVAASRLLQADAVSLFIADIHKIENEFLLEKLAFLMRVLLRVFDQSHLDQVSELPVVDQMINDANHHCLEVRLCILQWLNSLCVEAAPEFVVKLVDVVTRTETDLDQPTRNMRLKLIGTLLMHHASEIPVDSLILTGFTLLDLSIDPSTFLDAILELFDCHPERMFSLLTENGIFVEKILKNVCPPPSSDFLQSKYSIVHTLKNAQLTIAFLQKYPQLLEMVNQFIDKGQVCQNVGMRTIDDIVIVCFDLMSLLVPVDHIWIVTRFDSPNVENPSQVALFYLKNGSRRAFNSAAHFIQICLEHAQESVWVDDFVDTSIIDCVLQSDPRDIDPVLLDILILMVRHARNLKDEEFLHRIRSGDVIEYLERMDFEEIHDNVKTLLFEINS